MDLGQRRHRGKAARPPPPPQPQLYEDTSQPPPPPPAQANYAYPTQPDAGHVGLYPNLPPQGYDPNSYGGQQPQQPQAAPAMPAFPGHQLLTDPAMTNMAMTYGQTFADGAKTMIDAKINEYVPTSKIKYYFAVDTAYVGKKIGLLLFPFAHKDWSVRYSQDEPVAPRYAINAPDLYIPVMAFVTYILLAGAVLGTQNRFTPEQLGIIASSATVWLIIEILALLLAMYVIQVTTDLKYLDLLAYCGYKYVGMIFTIAGGALFAASGYYLVLLWCSFSLAFFLVRSLKMAIIPHQDGDGSSSYTSRGSKRRLYMLLVLAFTQPAFMWWLTRSIVFH